MARGYMSGVGGGSGSDDCTATAGDVLVGATAIVKGSDDEPVNGTLALTGNAQPQYVLEGQTFYSTDPKTIQNGSMPHLSNNTPIDFANGNTTPVIVCDGHFYDTNTDGVARMCFRYNGEAGYIVPNTLFGYPFSVNSILSFSVAVISGRRVTATWQNPIQAAGRPYSGVYIKYSTNGYPGTGGTQIYKGVGSNAASGGISTATFDLPNVGTTYYLSLYPYVTTSAGEFLGGVLNAQVTTGNTIINTYTSSTTVSVPTGYTLADIFCVGGGGGGSNGRSASRDHYGGGGGAGGYTTTANNVAVSGGQSLTVVVGAGGSAGNNGSASSVSRSGAVLCSANGGAGGETGTSYGVQDGGDGGSGGGGGGASGNPGYSGGNGGSNGGNGASAASASNGGSGQGRTTRAWGSSSGTLYSGGGGGGSNPATTAKTRPSGGSGGGGAGGARDESGNAQRNGIAGTANTGGGGGGGAGAQYSGSNPIGSGAAGGSGIVLIRFH